MTSDTVIEPGLAHIMNETATPPSGEKNQRQKTKRAPARKPSTRRPPWDDEPNNRARNQGASWDGDPNARRVRNPAIAGVKAHSPSAKAKTGKGLGNEVCPECRGRSWSYIGLACFCYRCKHVWPMSPEQLARKAYRDRQDSQPIDKKEDRAAHRDDLDRQREVDVLTAAELLDEVNGLDEGPAFFVGDPIEPEEMIDAEIPVVAQPDDEGSDTDSDESGDSDDDTVVFEDEPDQIPYKYTLSLDGDLEVPDNTTHVVLAQGGYLEYDDTIYEYDDCGWFPVKGGGRLPTYVRVVNARRYVVKGEIMPGGGAKLGGDEDVRVMSAFRVAKQTIQAMPFTWFKKTREALFEIAATCETVVSLGYSQRRQRTLYTNFTKRQASVTTYDRAFEVLNSKVTAAVHSTNNAIVLKKLLVECSGVPLDVLVDCALLFVERRAIIQKRLDATTAAAAAFINDKRAWCPPELDEGVEITVDDKLRASNDQGVYDFTSDAECMEKFAQGFSCVARRPYTSAHESYGHYHDEIVPNYMYQALNDKEELRASKRGVQLDGEGLAFTTYERCEETWSSVGTHFATQAAVINHKDTLEYVKSTRRLIEPRSGELEKRERAGVMGRCILMYLKDELKKARLDFKPDDELRKLKARILRADPGYTADKFNSTLLAEQGVDAPTLSKADHNYCKIKACMLVAYSKAELEGEGARLFDHIGDLTDYIDEIGSKVAMRKRNVKESVEGTSDSKPYLDVQMKPHEAQKYKNFKLKFGRMVVSITGEGWIEANPTVFFDGKHVLEHPMVVQSSHDSDFTVEYMSEVRRYKYPYPNAQTLIRRFWTRAVLSDTQRDLLADVVQEMEEQVADDPTTYAFINHGDDMLSALSHNGEVQWIEGDIANNDGSHVDSTFRQVYLVDRFRGENVTDAYAQLAYPVRFQNPMERTEYIYARYRHGMRLVSGSVLTTYMNCNKSQELGLAHAFYGGSFAEATQRTGFDVTTGPVSRTRLTDVSFLSRIFYHGDDGQVVCALDHASVLRKFGIVAGDVGGSSKLPISTRMVNHSIGVVKGHVGEPDSLLFRALRLRYCDEDGLIGRVKRRIIALTPYTEDDLSVHDYGALHHYYGMEEACDGIADYLYLVNAIRTMPLYGSVVFSNYVDKTMAKRYGMEPTVVV